MKAKRDARWFIDVFLMALAAAFALFVVYTVVIEGRCACSLIPGI